MVVAWVYAALACLNRAWVVVGEVEFAFLERASHFLKSAGPNFAFGSRSQLGISERGSTLPSHKHHSHSCWVRRSYHPPKCCKNSCQYALKYIQSALVASNLDRQIKVSTPLSSSIILDSFPPSQAFFNRSLNPVLVPMLTFLQSTGSFLMLNIYPYYDYMQSNGVIPLDYALFKSLPPNKEAVDSNTLLHYTNVFDAVVDAAYYAMAFLNFTNVPIIVTESGWPSKGDSNEPDATLENANTYNSNLIRHVLNKTGTPKHPGLAVSTFIYELYNEDTKPGPISEKNWGLFDANGTPIYILRLTGSGAVLSNDTTNQTFCITKDGADPKMLQAALDWACGPGKSWQEWHLGKYHSSIIEFHKCRFFRLQPSQQCFYKHCTDN
ncbi:hypothetical protein ACE6H2_009529 [Prunus campanulata]